MTDKYSATWVSYSSLNDWLNCPRSYFLKHIYRSPDTGHKIKLVSPPLTLGTVVHKVIETISFLPVKQRFSEPLMTRFDEIWQQHSGERGGFVTTEAETKYKQRGREMIRKLDQHPGPLKRLAVKLNSELPYFWLSEEDNIILCGKVDWLEYLPDQDAIHIIDFKTSRRKANSNSWQLPIYYWLVENNQSRLIKRTSYWYLALDDQPTTEKLPDLSKTLQKVKKVAKDIKLARQLNRFKCPQNSGCRYCRSLEKVVDGQAKLVGLNSFEQDLYLLEPSAQSDKDNSVIL